MPGIVGLVSKQSPDHCRETVARMVASMNCEPFYRNGTYDNTEMGIYGGWVALKETTSSSGLFLNEEKNIALLFSGECFGSGSETGGGWLIRLYEATGEESFGKINGLFSGLLIDRKRGKAYLFNDRYGIERIYWHETHDATYFASEAKALLAVLPAAKCFDDEGVAQFLGWGCTLGEKTLFQNVRLLPGGSLWSFTNGESVKRSYFRPESWEDEPTLSIDAFESSLQETFARILPPYFRSSSRIGISLTGGLDTRMIMACGRNVQADPICYTFAGEGGDTLDVRRAAEVASTCGLEHRILRIGNQFLTNFNNYVDRTVYSTDGCAGVTGSHEIYFNELARSLSHVRLTGNFGSEILRGMSTFKPLNIDPGLQTGEMQTTVARSVNRIEVARRHLVGFAAFREIPFKLFGTLAAARSQITFRTPYLDNELVRLAFRRPPIQPNSPLPALRFVKRNHAALAQIATDRGQIGDTRGLGWCLRRAFSEVTFKLDYFHKEGLPGKLTPFEPGLNALSRVGLLGLHKFLPFRRWFQNELASSIREKLSDSRIVQNPYWNAAFIRNIAEDHICGRKNYVAEINAVLTLEAVDRLLLRGS